jgi:hypothetical protein
MNKTTPAAPDPRQREQRALCQYRMNQQNSHENLKVILVYLRKVAEADRAQHRLWRDGS